MSFAIAGSIIAGKKTIEKLAEDLYAFVKSECGLQIKAWKSARQTGTLYKRLKQIRFVKTIWQSEKEIDLARFYCDSRLLIEKKRVVINDLADVPHDGNLLFEGTVGQGKSIFMRYLVSCEVAKGEKLPVFIQLMRITSQQSLLEAILQELRSLGLEMDQRVFESLANAGKIILFLDAFDELAESQQPRIIRELEILTKTSEGLRVVVTSRPDRPISTCSFFWVFKLAPLKDKEYETVIRRMAQDDKVSASIIKGVSHSQQSVRALLTTPLMIALLMVRYKVEQSIPENEIAFYDGLFMLLLQRHDKSKGGYVRPRKTKLGDYALQDHFNAICYLARKNRTEYNLHSLHSIAKEAITLLQSNTAADSVLVDIIEITCLIIVEGDEWRFVHKSVQEYHTALFIKQQPEASAAQFYLAMRTRWDAWEEELRFLRKLDRYRFLKHFEIPELRDSLDIAKGADVATASIDINTILRALGKDEVLVGADGHFSGYGHESSGSFWPMARSFNNDGPPSFVHRIFQKKREILGGLRNEKGQYVVSDIIQHNGPEGILLREAVGWFEQLRLELQKSEQEVRRAEDTKKLFDF